MVGTSACNVDARTAIGYTSPGTITASSLFEASNAGAGGTCSITVTEFGVTGGTIRGTFIGHLLNHASPAAVAELTSGTFTLDAP
jgi:hypothetical protein